MKLLRPQGQMTQPFAVNYNPAYANAGLKGHTGQDYVLGYKQPINAVVTGLVYSTLNLDSKDYDKYRAVYQLIDDGEFSYEVSYGHIDSCLVKVGDIAQSGKPIATEGNWGTCYYAGSLVTPADKLKGWGSHLHFQVRKLILVDKVKNGKEYIRDANGYVKKDKKYYEVVDYTNGYNGCVDPEQFFDKPKFQFNRDLTIGDKGEDVRELQKYLNNNGFVIAQTGVGSKGNETDYFGPLTRKALSDFQQAKGIEPSIGYFGPLTRAYINANIQT